MKNKASKFLSVVLALIMVLSILPMSSITASAETVSGTCGENLTWTFDDETGTLTISGSGEMESYYANTVPWISLKASVKEIVFDGEITKIGDYAFYDFRYLTDVKIPESVTTIGDNAFFGCEKINSITIPDSVTELGIYVFTECDGATTLSIGKGLTEISAYAFSCCSGLKNVVIPDNITVIDEGAFWFCTGLESVTIPDSVTSIGSYAFEHCQSLKTVFIPDSVTSIGLYTFSYCISLTGITVDENNKYFYNDEYGVLFSETGVLKQYPAGRTDAFYVVPYPVNTIGCGAFADSKLTGVALSNCTDLINSYAFESCNRLKTIYIKSDLEKIGYAAFSSCYNLTDIYYSGPQSGGFVSWNNIEIDSYNSDLTDANIHYNYSCEEHTLDKWYVVNGTCESSEREARTCIYCAKGENRLTGNVIEHKISDWEVMFEPTCVGVGIEYRHCENCTLEETREIPATGHSYESVVTAPTCTEQGYTTNTCSVCGDVVVDNYIDALGHTSAEAVEENYVAPTCTDTGSKDVVVYCSACNAEVSRETVAIDALEHTLSEYEKVIVIPNCTKNGSKEVVSCCTECDTVISKEIVAIEATGHTSADVVEENYVAPTCTESGSVDKVIYCSECGEEISRETQEIEILEHIDEDNDGYCDDCDEHLCDHACHKKGIKGFFWKITRFFNRIFGTNKYCECGAEHY